MSSTKPVDIPSLPSSPKVPVTLPPNDLANVPPEYEVEPPPLEPYGEAESACREEGLKREKERYFALVSPEEEVPNPTYK